MRRRQPPDGQNGIITTERPDWRLPSRLFFGAVFQVHAGLRSRQSANTRRLADLSAHSIASQRGYEPSTSRRTALRSSSPSILLVRASPACPSKSRKNRYPTSGPFIGNDSIHVRLMLFFLKAVSA